MQKYFSIILFYSMQIIEIQCKIFEKIFAQMEKLSEKSTEMSDRITKIRAKLCRGKNKIFAEKINKSTQYASALCLGKSNPGKGMLEEILTAFPMVSRAWLYFGEGEMLLSDRSSTDPQSEPTATPQRTSSEPSLLQLYTEAVRENERLRLENDALKAAAALHAKREGGGSILYWYPRTVPHIIM